MPPASPSRSRSRPRRSRRSWKAAIFSASPRPARARRRPSPADPVQDHRARHQAPAEDRARADSRADARTRRADRGHHPLLAKGVHVSTALVLGGVSRFSQVKKIAPGVDILIATPGRLTDLVREGDLILSETTLAGARRGRPHARHGLHQRRQAHRQGDRTATARRRCSRPPCRPRSSELAKGLLKDPVRVEVAPQGTTAAEIEQGVVMARTKQKRQVLSTMLADEAMKSGHHLFAHQAWRRPRDRATSSATASRPPSSTATSRRTPARRR